MPLPLVPLAILGATGAYLALSSKKAPALQSLTATAPSGHPIQVVVPVTTAPPKPSSTPNVSPTSPTVITPTGASNLTVVTNQDVQRALNTLGVAKPALVVDGILGQASTAAIKLFQAQAQLAVTGAADAATKMALSHALSLVAAPNAALAAAAAAAPIVAQVAAIVAPAIKTATATGQFSNDIKNAQHMLNLLGASPALAEDGIAGPVTAAAVKAFQIVHGLVADGVVGPSTISALQFALAPGPAVMTGAMPEQQPTGPGDLPPAEG